MVSESGQGSGRNRTPVLDQIKNQVGGQSRHHQRMSGQGQGQRKGQGSQEKRKIHRQFLGTGGTTLTVSVPGSGSGSGSGIASRLGVRSGSAAGSGRSTTVSVPGSGSRSGIASRLGVKSGSGRGGGNGNGWNRDPRLNKKLGQARGQKRRATVSPIRFIKDDDVQTLVKPKISAPKAEQPQPLPRSIKLNMEEFMAQDPITVYPCPRKNPNLSTSSTRTRTVPPNFSYFLDTEETSASSSSSTSTTTSQPQSANWLMSFANNSSFGSFVPTDSRYGNSCFPALPRLDSQGNFLNYN